GGTVGTGCNCPAGGSCTPDPPAGAIGAAGAPEPPLEAAPPLAGGGVAGVGGCCGGAVVGAAGGGRGCGAARGGGAPPAARPDARGSVPPACPTGASPFSDAGAFTLPLLPCGICHFSACALPLTGTVTSNASWSPSQPAGLTASSNRPE